MQKREEYTHLLKLKQDNLDSFKWLYRLYYEKVYYFCLSFTKSPPDAEEITSDVFVKVWERRSMINPKFSLNPLLFKITRDLTWNYLKKTARKNRLREIFLQNYSRSNAHEGENEVLFAEYISILDQALEKLTSQQKRIFTLRYLKGRNLAQIAQELKISKNTVKVHLAKSKRFVQDYLRVHADINLIISLTTFMEIIFY